MKSVFALAALIAAFLLAGCATGPGKSGPAMVMRQGDLTVTLMLTACPKDSMVGQLIGPADVGDFKDAAVVFAGGTLKACWSPLDDKSILIIDERGNGGTLQQKDFSKTGVIMPKSKPGDWKHAS
jgi:hypothetical protein